MFMLDGNPLPLDTAFTHEEIQYPANWLRLATQEQRDELGITEIVYETRPDDRFYWVQDNGDGTFTATAKDLEQLKANWSSTVNATAYSMLFPSDWMIVKQLETSTLVAQEWLDYRAAVRAEANRLNVAITAAETAEDLISIVSAQSWPAGIA